MPGGDSSQLASSETRRLAAIMFTDIVGFSRQMGSDEARMLRLLDVHNRLIQRAVTEHHGHVIKTIGDATTGEHLWSERYDRPLKEIFALQDEIRRKVVASLARKLTDED